MFADSSAIFSFMNEINSLLSNIYAEVQQRFAGFDDPAHGWEHVSRADDSCHESISKLYYIYHEKR